MTNQEIVKLLRKVAAAYTLKNENRFKIIAYEKAADAIENSNLEARDLWQENKLASIPGVGKAISSHLDELFKKDKVAHFESIFKGLPQALFSLMDIPGFGAKKAYKLTKELKLINPETAVSELFEAAKAGKIAPIEGFGEKSQTDIIEAIERLRKGQTKENRMPLQYANAMAEEVLAYLKKHKDTKEAVPLGSLRRMVATVGDIDIAVSTNNPSETIKWFISYPKKVEIVEKGPEGATIRLTNGRQVDLRVQSPIKFGAMLQYFTGSKDHNIKMRELALSKGLSLNEYGLKLVGRIKNEKLKMKNCNSKLKIYEYVTEESLYNALGLPLIPPEIREDRGEIEAGLKKQLPKLVILDDIKGDLHIHSNYDLEPSHDLGSSSLKDLLTQAQKLNYEYIGISDHNPSYTKHDKNEIISILKARKNKFEHIISSTKSVRVHLFIMLETDILPDGKLPLPEDAFNYLDAIIVSIHSSFKMDKTQMTGRILKGLTHPKARILAHPSGRLLGTREGYDVDWDRLFKFCKEKNKAIEINAYPTRLDLTDTLVREAIGTNLKLIIDTDSHDVSQLELMRYGIAVARRGWAEKSDIINTLPYKEFKKWLLNK